MKIMRILLIEDEQDMARYLIKALRELEYEVIHADEASTGLTLALSEPWDLLITDRMLPHDQDGLEIVKTVREAGRQFPVLILSALANLGERVRGLREGGDDYLTKPFALPELTARVEALLRRSDRIKPDKQDSHLIVIADLVINLRIRKAYRADKPIALQPREFHLLEYLAKNQGQVVTRNMLLESVWNFHFDPGTNVIDVQISRLRTKLDKGFDPPLLHTIRGVGYKLGFA
jgi:two-component system OmpR family response regulator